ncbi:hypothetical protein CDAR_317471 [Caerostris darwini]|uniref:Transmembrane protein n=1 Tax=Caerostris darwini TaxID=1538125 RepID=A0AAV4Q6G1_9ARAC|nr:hypothetical protein CDAR_317471 [Caerostris darwini]
MAVLSAYKNLAIEIDDPVYPGNVVEHCPWLFHAVKVRREWHLLVLGPFNGMLAIFPSFLFAVTFVTSSYVAGRRDRFLLMTVISAHKHLGIEIDDPECPGNVVEYWPWYFRPLKVRREGHLENVAGRRDRFLLMTVLTAYNHLAIEIDDCGCPGNVVEHWP